MRYRKTREEKLAEVAEKSRDIARELIRVGEAGTWGREDVWGTLDLDKGPLMDMVFDIAKFAKHRHVLSLADRAAELAAYLEEQAEETVYAHYLRHLDEEDPSD